MHTLFEDFFIPAVKHSLLTTNSNCSLLLPLATVSPLAIFQYFSSVGSSFCISNTSAGVSFHSLSVGHRSGFITHSFTSPALLLKSYFAIASSDTSFLRLTSLLSRRLFSSSV